MNDAETLKIISEGGVGTTHFPHGWLGFNYDFSGICPTINALINQWHTLIIEVTDGSDCNSENG